MRRQETHPEALGRILSEWNPIGAQNLPEDEYDRMIKPLTRKLESGRNPEFLERFLNK